VAERAALTEECAAYTSALSGPVRLEAPDAHLGRVSLPAVIDTHRHTAFLRGWAAISTPVLVLWIGVLLIRPTAPTLAGFATFLLVFAGVEAVARRRVGLLLAVLAAVAVWVLAAASLVITLLGTWRTVLAVVLVLAAVVLLVVNLRELLGWRPRRRDRHDPPLPQGHPQVPPL
jgi:hypothetical protein